ETAEMMKEKDFAFRFEVNFGTRPLQLAVPGIGGDAEDSALEFALNAHFILGFALTDKLSIGIDAGVFRTASDTGFGERGRYDTAAPGNIRVPSTGLISLRPLSNIDRAGGPDGRSGPLDPRIGLKYNFISGQGLSVAILGNVWVPFGDDEMFLGDRSFVFEPKLAADWRPFGPLRISANAGFRFRKRTVLEAVDTSETMLNPKAVFDLGSEMVFGGGVVYELLPTLLVAAETLFVVSLPAGASWGDCELFDGTDCDDVDQEYVDPFGQMQDDRYFGDADYGDTAGYFLGGINYRLTPDTTLTASAGAGITGVRKDDFRLLAGVRWQPSPEGEKTVGRGDSDSDGVPDASDGCPDAPEDNDNFEDDDGCPERDNDKDGFDDPDDACPNEPEDRDGYQDDDGCPERDNDGDGVPDVADRCPGDKEDLDNFEDGDGCPDLDNDGDGIPDGKDQCPNEAEVVNGVDDLDGCPDAAVRTGPIYRPDKGIIDLQGKNIEFVGKTARFARGATGILDVVAGEITSSNLVVRIEVHVARSTRSNNKAVQRRAKIADKRLSNQRAQAVLRYLQRRANVDVRLVNQAQGLGSDRPRSGFAPYDSNQNRVDFVVVRQQQ
ncbi:MAG: transporter, partial [Deltaproteobacteria bacterium]|nr:transporter [Deltaproteobacteria bacterium]